VEVEGLRCAHVCGRCEYGGGSWVISARGRDLVNNVGFNIRKKVLDYTDDDYSRIMSTNLDSAFALCKALHGMVSIYVLHAHT